MKGFLAMTLLRAFCLAVFLPAAAWAQALHTLGEAEAQVPADWAEAGRRGDREVDFTGPGGAYLMVRWWFPDEPLTGHDGELSAETRSFPAGPALVRQSRTGPLVQVTIAFERLNRNGERLLLTVGGSDADPQALEALLLPIAESVRFAGDPASAATVVPQASPGTAASGGRNHHAEGGFSLAIPAGWTIHPVSPDEGHGLVALSPAGDALLHVAVFDLATADTVLLWWDRFLAETAIPTDILGESHDPFAGIEGVAVTLEAEVYPFAGITLPFRRGNAWIFTGSASEGNVMLASLHAADAPPALRQELADMAASFAFGQPAPTATAEAPPPAPAPAAPAAALSAAETLALVASGFEGGCTARDVAGDAFAGALAAMALAPQVVAGCAAGTIEAAVVSLPQDPRQPQAAMLWLRALKAAGGRDVALADPARRLLVLLRADGAAGFRIEVADLAATAPAAHAAAEPTAEPAEPPGQLFAGVESPDWALHLARRGQAEWTRFEGGAFVAEVPAGPDFRVTGLRTTAPIVRLPSASDGFATRLSIDLDTARLDNIVIALVEPGLEDQLDWHDHEVWLAVERDGDVVPELVLAVQQKMQGRMPLPDATALAGLQIEMRPDGLILVSNGTGAVLLEGRLAALPGDGPFHLQISATAPSGEVSALLALRGVRMEDVAVAADADPGALLADAPQEVELFDGRTPGPHFALHGPKGSAPLISVGDGLHVDAAGAALQGLGLFSPEPVIWLDRFGPGASARLRLEFDPAATQGVQAALAASMSYADQEPHRPRALLHWRKVGDAHYLTRTIDTAEPLHAVVPGIPAVVDLVLTPEGVQIVAEGFPDDVLPWPVLQSGAGLRLYVLAMGDHDSQAAQMAMRRITLLRMPAAPAVADDLPPSALEPLPVVRLFPDPAAPWEGHGVAGLTFEEAGQFTADGAVVVLAPEGYQGGRAGVLSSAPVAVLDRRLDRTSYRLDFAFDPAATDGAYVTLSQTPQPDMDDNGEIFISLVRQAKGRLAEDWLLHVQGGFYATWTRRIPAAKMAGWDGRLTLRIDRGAATVSLPGITDLHAPDLIGFRKGVSLFATVQSRSFDPYGAAKMTLRSVDGGWITPSGMTARSRLLLMGTKDFDAEEYVRLLRAELEETVP